MKKSAVLYVVAIGLLLLPAAPSYAWHHEHGGVPELASGPPPPSASWYYCLSSQAYYPDVKTCHEDWVKLPARPQ